ncbi:hypothetical protein Hanom_Chr04g00309561 [Helianthus anomalus]
MICCYIHSRFFKRMMTMNQIHLKVCFVDYELVSGQTVCGGGFAPFDYIAAKLAKCITDESEKLWLPPIRQDEYEG